MKRFEINLPTKQWEGLRARKLAEEEPSVAAVIRKAIDAYLAAPPVPAETPKPDKVQK